MPPKRVIKNRFKELLAKKEIDDGRNYTHRDIEAETGIATTTIGRFYRNDTQRPDLRVVETLCRWLDIDDIGKFFRFVTVSTNDEGETEPKEIDALLPLSA